MSHNVVLTYILSSGTEINSPLKTDLSDDDMEQLREFLKKVTRGEFLNLWVEQPDDDPFASEFFFPSSAVVGLKITHFRDDEL